MPAISAPNAISSAPAGLDGAVASESSAMVAAVPWRLPAWLLGAVLGAALQLQQPVLWPGGVYGAGLVGAGVGGGGARAGARRRRWGAHAATALAVGAGVLVMFALCGLRAVDYAAQGLAPALEGQDIRVTGVVAAMPQTNEAGTRIRGGVQASGYVRAGPKDEPPEFVAASWRHPVERARQSVRDAILERLAGDQDGSDPARTRVAGVVAALVTGDQRAIDRADWDVFRATGVAHLMSISGLHITLFAWLAALVVGALWRRSTRLCLAVPAPSAALAAGVVLAAAYALFSGWGVPAEGPVIMLAAIAVLQLSGRRWPWPQVWLWACAAVVVADPWALAQAGFWLSFVAVGILFATNSIAGSAYPTSARHHFYALIREQWVVTLALTPLTLLLFGQVSVVGFAANLVAIPWVTLVVTPLALGGVLWAPLWSLAALSLQPLAALLQWLALWPWAVVFLPAAPLWAGMLAVAGGALLATRLPWRLRLLAFPLLWPALWWQPVRPAAGQFELLAADIGQGNAVLVRTATHTLLYDAGPRFSRESDAGHRVLVPLLRALGERVETLMLSHRDADHTGGAAAGPQGVSALLVGDIEAPQEQALLARGAALQADLLLVPHHGSKTSSSPAFLDAVQPRTALVQAGYRNRFGHPAPQVLQRYRLRDIEVVESSRCGAATWASAKPAAIGCERDAGRRYWQHQMVPRADSAGAMP